MALEISSTAFAANGSAIPVAPHLRGRRPSRRPSRWSGDAGGHEEPSAVIVDDPDAPDPRATRR